MVGDTSTALLEIIFYLHHIGTYTALTVGSLVNYLLLTWPPTPGAYIQVVKQYGILLTVSVS